MVLDWSLYSSESGVRDTPLLLSTKSRQLILSALSLIDERYDWLEVDDATWDDIDEAVSEAYFEVQDESADMDFTPVGTMLAWMGEIADIPSKWLHCNDDLYVGTDYPELYAVLADIFKDAFGNFRVPNLQDRFVKGSGINDDVGEIGGENDHTLTIAELPAHHHIVPAHSHTVPARANAGSTAGVASLGVLAANATITTDTEPATDTSDTGSTNAHNNQPEYIAVHWIIKALP